MYDYEAPAKAAGLMMKLEYVGAKNNNGTPISVEFFAYLVSYSDSFTPEWQTEKTFGRTDPLVNYNSTSRKINVSFNIPAFDLAEARNNLFKLEKLSSFVYPVINSLNSVDVFSRKTSAQFQQGPILRFSFGNLIRDYQTNGGLYGFIDSAINIEWKLEHGIYISSGSSNLEPDVGKVTRFYPKIVEISLQYQVLHNYAIGWDVSSNYQFLGPYGFNRGVEGNSPQTGDGYSVDPRQLLDEFLDQANTGPQQSEILEGQYIEIQNIRKPTIGNKINSINSTNSPQKSVTEKTILETPRKRTGHH